MLWCARREAGQATLEAALIFPLLILLVIGMVSVAQVLLASNMVLLAAHRGGRVGAVIYGDPTLTPQDQDGAVKDAVRASLGAGLKGTEGREYTVEVTTDAVDLRVKVSYRVSLSIPWVTYLFGRNNWTVTSTAVYRVEEQPNGGAPP